jgi:hypothetical protein
MSNDIRVAFIRDGLVSFTAEMSSDEFEARAVRWLSAYKRRYATGRKVSRAAGGSVYELAVISRAPASARL